MVAGYRIARYGGAFIVGSGPQEVADWDVLILAGARTLAPVARLWTFRAGLA